MSDKCTIISGSSDTSKKEEETSRRLDELDELAKKPPDSPSLTEKGRKIVRQLWEEEQLKKK